jgi:dTMP kinase
VNDRKNRRTASWMKTFLVCFSGIDGSGKTTLCKEVISELRSRNIPSRCVYGRFLPVVAAPFFKVISALTLRRWNQQEQHRYSSENKKRLLSNPVLFRLFLIGILFDQSLRILLKICLPSILGKKVTICDRYLLDTAIVDIALSCGLSNRETIEILKRFLSMFPQADLVFVVDVPPRIAFQRKNDSYSIEILEQLSKMYLYVGKEIGATIIDGTQNPSEIKHFVLWKLGSIGIRPNLQTLNSREGDPAKNGQRI